MSARLPRPTLCVQPSRPAGALAIFALVLAVPAAAATLPFADGFEPPQTAFSNWTTTQVNGGNALVESGAQAWNETRSLRFSFAGNPAEAKAAAVVDFASAVTEPHVRFFFYVPAGTEAAMASASGLRLVRLGDAVTFGGSGGAAKVNLVLRKDPTNGLYLRLEYVNSSAGVTTFGTALTTRITEASWHYVEFAYRPAGPRVQVFIDDPAAARIDQAPADLLAHDLWTAWVGLAGAADAQGSPLSFHLDDVVVGTAFTGTALSTSQSFDEVESGTLAVTNQPPGKASTTFLSAGVSITAAGAAAHLGSFGVRVADSDGQSGQGAGAAQVVRITATGGTVYRRFWWRPTATNGQGSRVLSSLNSTNVAGKALAEAIAAGDGTLSVGGVNAGSTYSSAASSLVAGANSWHLVELVATGVGTSGGTRSLSLDGALAIAQTGIDWTGVSVDSAADGQPTSADRTFQGTDDFDDLRLSRAPMPSRLVLSAPALADRTCSGAITLTARDSSGAAQPVPEPTLAALGVSGVTGGFYSDDTCTSPVTHVALPVGTSAATVYFKPGRAGSGTLTASNLDYLSGPVSVAVASLATQLGFSTAPLIAAAGACSLATIEAQDGPGVAASVAADTVVGLTSTSATMAFFADPACTTPGASVTIAAGQADATFYVRDTQAGGATLTASAGGLSGATQDETIEAADPSKLVFTSAPVTVVAGGCSGALDIQAQDTYGNPASLSAGATIWLGSSSATGLVYSDSTCSTAVTSIAIAPGQSNAAVFIGDTRAGTPLLTAAATGFLNGTQTQTVAAAPGTQLVFSTSSQAVTAGVCSGIVTVQAQDPFGNRSAPTADLTLTLFALPSSLAFHDAPGCGDAAVSQLVMGAGSSERSWYFQGTSWGTVSLAVSAAGLSDAVQDQLVTAAAASNLAIISAPQLVSAGGCSGALLVQAQDGFGNPAIAGADSVIALSSTSSSLTFHGSGACGVAVTEVTLVAGSDTVGVYFRDEAIGTPTLTVSAAGLGVVAQDQTIKAAAPSLITFSTPPRTALAGGCSAAVTIEARDGYGNASPVVSATSIALSSTSSGGRFFSNASCGVLIGQGVIAAGSSSVTVYYRDTRIGAPTLTASNPGLSSPTQGATIDPGPPAKLAFTSAPQSLTAGSCSAIAALEVRDAFDNPSPVTADLAVSLLSSAPTTTFHTAAGCAAGIAQVVVPSGAVAAGFFFADPRAGNATLTAQAPGLSDGTQVAAFLTGTAAMLGFSTPPHTFVAGTCSPMLTVQVQDATGNPVTVGAAVSLALFASAGGIFADPACTAPATEATVAAGQSGASFFFRDERSGPKTLAASTAGLAPASQVETVSADVATGLVVLSAPQSIAAGACSAGVGLEARDQFDNPAPGAAPTLIALSSTAPSTQFFSDAACATQATQVAAPAGAAFATLYFRDPKAGAVTLTFTVEGLPPATQPASFAEGAPVAIGFATAAQTVSANTCSARVTLQSQDALGNPSDLASAALVSLSSSSPGGTFYSDPTCTSPISAVTIAAGESTAAFFFKEVTLGAPTLTAASPPLADGTQQETIVAQGAPAKLAFAALPAAIEAGACSESLVVEIKDAEGNSATVAATTEVTLSASTATAGFSTSGACAAKVTKLSIPAGAYQAVFHLRETVVSALTLTATSPSLAPVTEAVNMVCPAMTSGAPCDDADLCNGRETCQQGVCASGAAPTCADNDACTVDSCEATAGCLHQAGPGCCRSPALDAPRLEAAVGVPYRISPSGQAALLKGTGPIRFAACDSPPAGFRIDAITGLVDWTPTLPGSQPLCIEATGACGTDLARFTVTVRATLPAAPVAALSLSSSQVKAGESIEGDAQASAGDTPLSFEWNWGDGSPPAYGPKATHRYGRAGAYFAQVLVIDPVGQAAAASATVQVTDATCASVPVARIVADRLAGDGSLAVAFRCDCTSATGARFRWDFGDGTSAVTSEASHTFGPGAWRVRLAVDAAGCTSFDSAEVRVTRNGAAPPSCSLSVQPPVGPAPLSATFAAVFGDSDGKVATAAMAFSDGLSADATRFEGRLSRTVDSPGELTAALTVTDDSGLTCRTSAVALATTVKGLVPPRITSVPATEARCGRPYSYDEDSRAEAAGSAVIRWSLGRGPAGAGAPAGMTIDEASGALTWTPDLTVAGPTRVTIAAANEAGVAEQDYLVAVECPEAPKSCGCGSGDASPLLGLLLLVLSLRRSSRRRA